MAQPVKTATDESKLLAALRRGDEAAFMTLYEMYHAGLVRLAGLYVNDRAQAEEVAAETWLGVLNGLNRFEGRSSLKTWIFTILVNRAKTRGQRESRSIPFSALGEAASPEPSVDPDRFIAADDPQWANHWKDDVISWEGLPEVQALNKETGERIRQAIAALPPLQKQVITLRDMQGFGAAEVCNILEISETNQRVLLHRARSKVRQALETYINESRA